ncbi:PsbP-related protein [Flavobacterium sp. NRK F7]|uniref:PsbP-related protein n=1 Tax=Flavobacterium sp. NRK F7 TaxID=2954930 RepID=UPI0020913D6C|nr:hypothetical protein [Flavobacterium sp. NRK F7]MCO6163026.1 hypothetical protein [Flavobacterium sp. NRK F7]
MKNIKLILILLIANTCLGQNTFKNESLGFNIEQPEKWIVAKSGESLENIKKQIKLDTETLNKLLEQNKGTIQVVTFYKYPIETTPGIIPTIKVNLRKNNSKTFDEFKNVIEESFSSIKNVFPDFQYLSNPVKTKISGLDCVKAVCAYTLKAKNGEEKVTITVYAVPIKNQFYQITFMDSEKEDNTELYNELAKTIEIY